MHTRLIALLLIITASLTASPPPERENQEMLTTLDTIRHAYWTRYAPYEWKEELFGWRLDDAIDAARQQILALPAGVRMSTTEFQRLVSNFQQSMRDYHVMISFYRTEKATLPIGVRGAEGRYFLVDIDRSQLPESTFPFNVGDELVTFGGRPTDEVVQELRRSDMIENVAATDQRLTEMFLCYRSAAIGYLVPKGPISLGFKRKDEDKVRNVQLMWRYTEERVATRGAGNWSHFWPEEPEGPCSLLEKMQMTSPIAKLLAVETRAHGHSLGARRSFLPRLGDEIKWESKEDCPFDAYIYVNDNGNRIGVLRIPEYGGDTDEAKQLAKILRRMERKTDALVIDQLNNPGGYVAYLMAVLSMFSDQPLDNPWHQVKLTPSVVFDAQKDLAQLKSIKTHEDAVDYFGEDIHGLPVTMELVLFAANWQERIVDCWSKGEDLTADYPFDYGDKIPPHPTTHYSKPLLVLINELDFSCGDWFPACLQDNGRATLLGTRTAGAGGCVEWFDFPNSQGIAGMSVTWTLAHRPSGNPIENLGIQPDIFVPLTAEDFQNDYAPFVEAVNSAVENLIAE